jgi:hypothetical protein
MGGYTEDATRYDGNEMVCLGIYSRNICIVADELQKHE